MARAPPGRFGVGEGWWFLGLFGLRVKGFRFGEKWEEFEWFLGWGFR